MHAADEERRRLRLGVMGEMRLLGRPVVGRACRRPAPSSLRGV
jgi:hypothetical protein